jgi:hypothetical protein
MKKQILASIAFLSTLLPTQVLASVPEWFGIADWDYTVICIDGPTNARINPNFSNNIRAELVDGTCGNVLYRNSQPIYENTFYLIEFYIDEIQEVRRYWIHESQIKTIYN